MQEHINERTVALSVKGAKITGRLLAQAMRVFLKKSRDPTVKHGKQSIKSLMKQGANLTNIEISGSNIGDFKRIARKYNVDFALKKDSAADPPRHIVFFKAKDGETLTAAFNEYSKVKLKVRERPDFLEKLNKYKEKARNAETPVKHREKGEMEH